MIGLITGVGLFVSAAIIANYFQTFLKYSYESKPVIFLSLFCTSLIGAWFIIPEILSLLQNVYILITAIVYIVTILFLVQYWKPMQKLYCAHTVPVEYGGIIQPKPAGQIVKTVEIILQDVSAWLIVGGLLALFSSFNDVVLIFTIIVFLLHVPGLWLFGRVYGSYFLVMSTALAFLVPFLYLLGTVGFLYLYALHLSGYILMYILMGTLGKSKIKT
jgi:hypothetical protein